VKVGWKGRKCTLMQSIIDPIAFSSSGKIARDSHNAANALQAKSIITPTLSEKLKAKSAHSEAFLETEDK
jgi:hypothetical protein